MIHQENEVLSIDRERISKVSQLALQAEMSLERGDQDAISQALTEAKEVLSLLPSEDVQHATNLTQSILRAIELLDDFPSTPLLIGYPLNLDHRLGWIKLEAIDLLHRSGNQRDDTKKAERESFLSIFRDAFSEDQHGRPKIWESELRPTKTEMHQLKQARNSRLLSADIRFFKEAGRNYLESPNAENLENFLKAFTEINLLSIATEIGVEKEGLILNEPKTEAGKIFAEIRRISEKITKGVSEGNIISKDEFESLTDLLNKASLILQQKWVLKGGLPDDVEICQYDTLINVPNSDGYESLASIAKKLVINLEDNNPQNGYGREVPRDEFENFAKLVGVQIFVVTYKGKDAGYYILLTDQEGIMPHTLKAYSELSSKAHLDRVTYGWGEIVGVDKDVAAEMHQIGLSAYDILHQGVIECCLVEDIDVLFGMSRRGSQANTSYPKLEKKGWVETGESINCGGIPYAVLRCDIAPVHRVSPERGTNFPLAYNQRSFEKRRAV